MPQKELSRICTGQPEIPVPISPVDPTISLPQGDNPTEESTMKKTIKSVLEIVKRIQPAFVIVGTIVQIANLGIQIIPLVKPPEVKPPEVDCQPTVVVMTETELNE